MSISTTSCACSQVRPGVALYRCLLLLQDGTISGSGPLCSDCAHQVGALSLLDEGVKDYEVAPWQDLAAKSGASGEQNLVTPPLAAGVAADQDGPLHAAARKVRP